MTDCRVGKCMLNDTVSGIDEHAVDTETLRMQLLLVRNRMKSMAAAHDSIVNRPTLSKLYVVDDELCVDATDSCVIRTWYNYYYGGYNRHDIFKYTSDTLRVFQYTIQVLYAEYRGTEWVHRDILGDSIKMRKLYIFVFDIHMLASSVCRLLEHLQTVYMDDHVYSAHFIHVHTKYSQMFQQVRDLLQQCHQFIKA